MSWNFLASSGFASESPSARLPRRRVVLAAIRAGGRGYLVKGADRDEVLRAIRAAAAGEAIFSRRPRSM